MIDFYFQSVCFVSCLQEKANENGLEPREFANLSQAELSLRMGTDASLMGGTWKKGRKGKVGYASPPAPDKEKNFLV